MTKAIILAAGKGKRLLRNCASKDLPKVMQTINDKPLISYVLGSLSFIDIRNIIIVVGFKKEQIIESLGDSYYYVEQQQQLGTGHAVMAAVSSCDLNAEDVLVCCGDMPLVQLSTYQGAIAQHYQTNADCTLLTCVSKRNLEYGRIVRVNGKFVDIVEYKDCTTEQRQINELNSGVYIFKGRYLARYLHKLNNVNSQKEYYLTDLPKIFVEHQKSVETYQITEPYEIYGVNTVEDLNFCSHFLTDLRKRDEF